MLQHVTPGYRERAAAGDENARAWLRHFIALGRHFEFALTDGQPENDGERADDRKAA